MDEEGELGVEGGGRGQEGLYSARSNALRASATAQPNCLIFAGEDLGNRSARWPAAASYQDHVHGELLDAPRGWWWMIDKVLNPLAVPQNAWLLLLVMASTRELSHMRSHDGVLRGCLSFACRGVDTHGLSHVRSHDGVLLVGARACVPPGMTAVAHLSVLEGVAMLNEFGKHSGPPYLEARDGRLPGTRPHSQSRP